MKKFLRMGVLLVAGGLVGGGAAYGTQSLLGVAPAAVANSEDQPGEPTRFVATGDLMAPLTYEERSLAGYVSFKAELEVSEANADLVKTHLPLFAHEVNIRTFRMPLASGPGGVLPNLGELRKILEDAAAAAYGEGMVSRIAIVEAVPA